MRTILVILFLLTGSLTAGQPYRSIERVELWTFEPDRVGYSLSSSMEVLVPRPPAFAPSTYPIVRACPPRDVRVSGEARLEQLRVTPYPGQSAWGLLTPVLGPADDAGAEIEYRLGFNLEAVPFLHGSGRERLISLTQTAPEGASRLFLAVPDSSVELRAYDTLPDDRFTSEGWRFFEYRLEPGRQATIHLELRLAEPDSPAPTLESLPLAPDPS
ncbi:MAG: hypothetical protein HY319_32635 [Armatimonadetes bacterium]|nr:hypothetical protein [Armatimonadota bacterium]